MTEVTGPVLALAGAYGVFLVYTAVVFGWRGLRVGPPVAGRPARRDRIGDWLVQAGLGGSKPAELVAVSALLAATAGSLCWAVFGGAVPAVIVAGFAATVPLASARARRDRRRAEAREAWPRLIEELRLQATSAGRSVPQALFAVGVRAPAEMQPAFEAAYRDWLLTTDFARTVGILKARLADATADAVCETLLVANEVGGSDLDQRLEALVIDRVQDLQGRKDAEAKQAGARFARRFVLLVPLGMALAGLTIGSGRAAYQTAFGQALVVAGLVLVGACWLWAGRIMRLPPEQRVFFEEPP